MSDFHATTILAVQKDGEIAVGGDGQVTFGNSTVIKHHAKKIRRLYDNKVIAGFAGSVADAFTLCEKFEEKLKEYRGGLLRPRWSSPRTGAPIKCCGIWKPC
jgi:ATP-dependent HslUV protease subunit HslV